MIESEKYFDGGAGGGEKAAAGGAGGLISTGLYDSKMCSINFAPANELWLEVSNEGELKQFDEALMNRHAQNGDLWALAFQAVIRHIRNEQTQKETLMPNHLPKWQSHKIVEGFKIGEVDGLLLTSECGRHSIVTNAEVVDKIPQHGDMGYFVCYKDGYHSWSPTEAFEEGNTPIDESHAL